MVSAWIRASIRFIGEISWKKNTGIQWLDMAGGKTRPGFQFPHVSRTEPASLLLRASMSVVSMPSAVPPWALATIVLVSGLLVFSCCFCLYRKRCRRRMGKKSQTQAQVHLQEVKELGRSYIDKVWPGPAPSRTPALLHSPATPVLAPFPSPPTLLAHLPYVSSPKLDPGDLEINQIYSLFARTFQFGGEVRYAHRHLNTGWHVIH